MLELKEYEAIQEFTMSIDNGKTPIYVKKGEPLMFDGLNVVFRGEQGTARSLSKVIGEWIAPVGTPTKPVGKQLASTPRNATGGKVVEHSDYTSDPEVGIKNPPSDSVTNLLKSYDKTPPIKLVNGKREVTSDMDDIKKEVTIINDDANEVRKVSANDGAPITNKGSVEMGKDSTPTGVVLSPEGEVAKATNYSGKDNSTPEVKRLTIDYEASGVEVRKTTPPKGKVAKSSEKMATYATDDVVAETSYPAIQTTDVGSSTQAQVGQLKDVKKSTAKKSTAKKASTKKGTAKKVTKEASNAAASDSIDDLIDSAPVAPAVLSTKPTVARGIAVESEGQEAVVISKVTRDKRTSVQTEDGIVSRVTVGSSDSGNDGEVTFSSNNDFEDPVAKFSSSGEDTPYDVSEEDVFGKDSETEVIDASDDDIDLNDLLSEV